MERRVRAATWEVSLLYCLCHYPAHCTWRCHSELTPQHAPALPAALVSRAVWLFLTAGSQGLQRLLGSRGAFASKHCPCLCALTAVAVAAELLQGNDCSLAWEILSQRVSNSELFGQWLPTWLSPTLPCVLCTYPPFCPLSVTLYRLDPVACCAPRMQPSGVQVPCAAQVWLP